MGRKLCSLCEKKSPEDGLSKFQPESLITDEKKWSDNFKKRYVVLAFFWVIYIWLWIQLPSYQKEELVLFEPYEILGVEQDASPAVLKKAYRKLSLAYHPDKNPDNQEEAEQKFLLVSKAYQTLTDPELRKNFDEFGSADGFQGATGSIGLPSWLTRKDNELHILLLYFLFLIVLPPICVFLWWRKASSYHALGVRNGTVRTYWINITEQMAPKFLIEILAASDEFVPLNRPVDQASLIKLWRLLKDKMVKMKFVKVRKGEKPSGYIFKGTVLLYAYMLRTPIPESLQPDLKAILKEAHRLLDVMCEMCIGRQMYWPALGSVELMQSISQALLIKEFPLQQLPHFTERDATQYRSRRISSLVEFRQATEDKKKKVVSDLTEEEWKDIENVVTKFPIVKLDFKYEVEDEDGIYENDFVTVTAKINRVEPEFFQVTKEVKKEQPKKQKGGKKTKRSVTKKSSGGKKAIIKTESNTKIKKLSDDDIEARERKLLEELPTVPQNKKKDRSHAPIAYSNYYPFQKKEIWYIFLICSPRKGAKVVGFQKLYSLDDEIKMKIRVGTKGNHEYDLIAKCDAYVGCDVEKRFTISVEKMSKAVEDERDRLMGSKLDDDDDNSDDDEDDEPEGVWYYLGFSSILELILNIVVLGLFAVFVRLFSPAWNAVYPKVIEPWFTPLWSVLCAGYDKLATYFPEENITDTTTEHVDL